METVDENLLNDGTGLELQNVTLSYLAETRKWAKFLAILGFIFVGLMVIAGLVMMVSFSQFDSSEFGPTFPSGLFGLIYIAMAALYFFPVLYLYRFSDRMKLALNHNDSEALTQAFQNLKSHYKFIGIMTVVILALYIIGIIAFLVVGATALSTF